MSSLFRKLIDLGRRKQQEKHDEQESEKLGTYRVGSGGIYYNNSTVGTCHRVAIARYLGIEQPISDDKQLMFSEGIGNEAITELDLMAGNDGAYRILREDECPVLWTTEKGTQVTGRPDFVLSKELKPVASFRETDDGGLEQVPLKHTFELVAGLELKAICSIWTARDVYTNRQPKLNHLIQAAHYSSRLNIPFELLYISRVNHAIVGDWVKSFFAKNLSKAIELNDKGEPKNVLPFDSHFELQFNTNSGDVLCFRHLEDKLDSGWTPTIVTQEGIANYYAYLDYLRESKDLGPRPNTVELDGTPCKGWVQCKYCEFKPMCDKSERNYERWIEDVRKIGRDLTKLKGKE
jgi:hypothetical protein